MIKLKKILYRDVETNELIEDQITESAYKEMLIDVSCHQDIEILACDWDNSKDN